MFGAIKRIWSKPELRLLIKHSIFTGVTTACSLILRYLIMAHLGVYHPVMFGRTLTIELTDDLAYIVYCVSGILILFLLKWFHADGVRGRSFLPRLLAFSALNIMSMFVGFFLLGVLTGRLGLGDELAFWMTCPLTFAINFYGSRIIVFCDAENRESKKIRMSNEKEAAADGREETRKPNDSAE